MHVSKPIHRTRWWLRAVLVGVLWSAAAPNLSAQQNTSDQMAQAISRAQALLRQLAQEKALVEADLAQLRAQNAKSTKKLAASEEALEAAADELGSARRDLTTLRTKSDRIDSRLAKTTRQLQEVVAKYKTQAKVLHDTTADRDRLAAELQATTAELTDSEKKNLALYTANTELVERLGAETSWTSLLRKEPVTGIKQVEIENIVQEYQHKLRDELRANNAEATAR